MTPRFCLFLSMTMLAAISAAQTPAAGPYKVLKTAKVGGAGNFDYVYADVDGRKLYIPRTGQPNPRVTVFNLDTLAPAGEIANASARGAVVDPKSGHGFSSSKPVILFASCAMPAAMVILSADDGKIITSLPIGNGTDGAGFNPATMEAFSSQRDGTLTVVKENSPTSFVVEQTVKTMTGAKTMTIDTKTNQILLIAAEYAPPATPPPGGRAGRGTMIPDSFSIIVVGK